MLVFLWLRLLLTCWTYFCLFFCYQYLVKIQTQGIENSIPTSFYSLTELLQYFVCPSNLMVLIEWQKNICIIFQQIFFCSKILEFQKGRKKWSCSIKTVIKSMANLCAHIKILGLASDGHSFFLKPLIRGRLELWWHIQATHINVWLYN